MNRPHYPIDRQHHRVFALKFLRLLIKTAAAQTIGTEGCWLLAIVVNVEDKTRYRRGVTFYNEQLMSLLGFTRWHRLDAVRSALVEAGWLHYEPPPKGLRGRPGVYWVTVPGYALALPDDFGDEGGPSTESVDIQNPPSTHASTESVDSHPAPSTESVDRSDDRSIELSNPILSLTSKQITSPAFRSSCPNAIASDAATGDQVKDGDTLGGGRKPAFSPEDRALADWFWQSILALQPDRKPPNLDKWANSVRLMRERDGRTHTQVRELITLIRRDAFWQVNILSPDKLREKFDDLVLRLKHSPTARSNGRRIGPGQTYDPHASHDPNYGKL